MLPTITPVEAHRLVCDGKARLVDIREPEEQGALRLPGAEAAPLSVLPWMDFHPADEEHPIIFTCNSGNRTAKNSELLQALAAGRAWQLDGGVQAWARQGLEVERGGASLPLFRQIQIGAGSLVLLGLAGSLVWPPLCWLSAIVGAGLIFAGVTGFCGLGRLLALMPWNKKN
ncbi:rhodanese family protein [uncultured Desulfovibrio sp.]|uniref:rhodanese family protein n=1 Tax=uncultured Desulfovibrio sp. TaxID=167968 RepID=UPI002631241F|nr:rhodanese family protein [uncultured Desulfovibrio sp.]